MLKQLFASSKRILVAPRVDASFSQSRTAASSAESRASAEKSYEEEANNTAKTQKPKNGKPPPARRLAYKSPPRDLLFGIHPVEIALAEKRRKFYKLFLRPNRVVPFSEDLQNIADWAANLKVPIVYKRNGELSSLTNESLHQGVVLQASRLNHKDWSEQIEIFGESDNDGKLLVYMDRVMDPMNMGAVIRSCVFLGVDTILVPSKYSCKLSPTVSKASSGALECAPICTVEDPQQLMVFVQKLGWEVLGTDSDCLPYDQYEATSKNRLLILGNEGHGVNEELVNFFSKTISVPGVTNRVGSLNVSVTAGILLSHFSKHKRLL